MNGKEQAKCVSKNICKHYAEQPVEGNFSFKRSDERCCKPEI